MFSEYNSIYHFWTKLYDAGIPDYSNQSKNTQTSTHSSRWAVTQIYNMITLDCKVNSVPVAQPRYDQAPLVTTIYYAQYLFMQGAIKVQEASL